MNMDGVVVVVVVVAVAMGAVNPCADCCCACCCEGAAKFALYMGAGGIGMDVVAMAAGGAVGIAIMAKFTGVMAGGGGSGGTGGLFGT
jgi:hypothetical protein